MNEQLKWFYAGVAEMGAIFSFAAGGHSRPVPRMTMQTTDTLQLPLLQEFCQVLGVSDTIREYPPSSRIGSRKTRHIIQVAGAQVYEKVVPFFDAFPMRGAKAQQYDIWRELVMGLQRGEYDGTEGMKRFRARWAEKSPDKPAAGRTVQAE